MVVMRSLRRDRALLAQLNDCVGASARLAFQQQLGTAQLLQKPQQELAELLPGLCAFVELLDGDKSELRRVFGHPEAQWLSRSARQSGISAVISQQLVRIAGRSRDNAELAVQILLDALLTPCTQRLGGSDACTWRTTQEKPRFHAMPCFPVWSAVMPFAAQLGTRHPTVFVAALRSHRTTKQRRRANCDFAHVTGLWRLMEEMTGSETRVMTALLQFMVREKLLLGLKNAKHDRRVAEMQLDDQLLDKFFTGMQEFAFKSGRAAVIKPALLDALVEVLANPLETEEKGSVPPRISMFAAVGSMYAKGLAAELVPQLIQQLKEMPGSSSAEHDGLLAFVVGYCAHVDLVPISSVLELQSVLLDLYKAAPQSTEDTAATQQRKLAMVFYVVYVGLHRRQAIDSLRQEVGSEPAALMELVSHLQMRLCSEVAYNDFYVAAPVHWTAAVWKHWVFLSDQDVQAFAAEAREMDAEVDDTERMKSWNALTDQLPFRSDSAPVFPRMFTLLQSHLVPYAPLVDPDDEFGLIVHRRKRRRAEESRASVDPEQLERSFDVLLLPDVMERVCSFMSAKRLCRMALVCRTFAALSHRATLWRPLYMKLGHSTGVKYRAAPSSQVRCQHGDSYPHDWRQLYMSRWQALRRLRRLQRRAIEAGEATEPEALDNISTSDAPSSSAPGSWCPRICTNCGCDRVFKSATELDAHLLQHKDFTCLDVSCRASFTSAAKLKQHTKQQHPKPAPTPKEKPAAKPKLVCGLDHCTKSYSSAKWLATHRHKHHGQRQT